MSRLPFSGSVWIWSFILDHCVKPWYIPVSWSCRRFVLTSRGLADVDLKHNTNKIIVDEIISNLPRVVEVAVLQDSVF